MPDDGALWVERTALDIVADTFAELKHRTDLASLHARDWTSKTLDGSAGKQSIEFFRDTVTREKNFLLSVVSMRDRDTVRFELVDDKIVLQRFTSQIERSRNQHGRPSDRELSRGEVSTRAFEPDDFRSSDVDDVLLSLKGDTEPSLMEKRSAVLSPILARVAELSDRFGGKPPRMVVSDKQDGERMPVGAPWEGVVQTSIPLNGVDAVVTAAVRTNGTCDLRVARIGIIAEGRVDDMDAFLGEAGEALYHRFDLDRQPRLD